MFGKVLAFFISLCRVCGTYLIFSFTAVFFRADTLPEAGSFLKAFWRCLLELPKALSSGSLWEELEGGLVYGSKWLFLALCCALFILFIVDLISYKKCLSYISNLFSDNEKFPAFSKLKNDSNFIMFANGMKAAFCWAGCLLLAFLILWLGAYGAAFDASQFIYFQF
ncbi:MAG: hypothetical protein IJU50_07565 [Lachnospiraceae bacterium]|nr:hypothetical protein [Lachnospiraceae bacterium]